MNRSLLGRDVGKGHSKQKEQGFQGQTCRQIVAPVGTPREYRVVLERLWHGTGNGTCYKGGSQGKRLDCEDPCILHCLAVGETTEQF